MYPYVKFVHDLKTRFRFYKYAF